VRHKPIVGNGCCSDCQNTGDHHLVANSGCNSLARQQSIRHPCVDSRTTYDLLHQQILHLKINGTGLKIPSKNQSTVTMILRVLSADKMAYASRGMKKMATLFIIYIFFLYLCSKFFVKRKQI
jgi:hypothetical protein